VTLAAMVWAEISIHQLISEYLRNDRSELDKLLRTHHLDPRPWLSIIDNPQLNDTFENHKRLRLFYLKSGLFWVEIPPDTKWYEVQNLTDNELDKLYISARHNQQWASAGYQLETVAVAEKLPLTSPPVAWGRIILWGHDKIGPFSIIEGNHRLLAYKYNPPPPLNIPVYIGLSPSYCRWHHADPDLMLGWDLYRKSYNAIVVQNSWLWVWPR